MSIRIMSMVWDRYPASGGELLLALAMADHAHDNGAGIYAGVQTLASKTRQSVRTVQYQLKAMQASGWLIKVGKGDGGRSRHATYRINPDWLKGAEIAPFTKPVDGADDAEHAGVLARHLDAKNGPEEPVEPLGEGVSDGATERADQPKNGATTIAPFVARNGATTAAPFRQTKGCNLTHKRVQQLLHPSIKPDEPYISPLPPHEGESGGVRVQAEPSKQVQVPAPVADDESKRAQRRRSGPVTIRAYIEACTDAGTKPVPEGCRVFEYAEQVGIPREILQLHWLEFRERNMETDKRQKDWLRTLLNSVKGNWYGLWVMSPDGVCVLSTKGRQAEAWHARDVGRAA